MQRRQWLDMAAVSARNAALMSHLAHCSAQLDQVVEPLHRAGVPVLLAPMHTVSDVLATLVGAGVYPGRATVIVSGDVQAFARRSPEDEWRQRLDYCSIHDDPRHIAGTLSQAMLEAAEHRRNIILFPDITPDYTLHSNQDVAAKLACHLFGRPAHLHSGIVRLSRALRAQVVFYSLYFDRGIRIHIEEPVAADRVGRVMPAIVERTLRRHADDWLLWHSHSLFLLTNKSGISQRMENTLPTPVLQSEINECGLACIAMLAETQGIRAPLTELRERYPASQHGTSLATLCAILGELALPAYPVAFEHRDLAALPLPAILHYGAGHYVLLAYRQGYVCVMNLAL